ncbi:MAG TPA: 50S ribosomal protein L24, partial [Armatimonadetes bacterium]|nr:50S ribosomal protein L24 [Armatimonadota bacterium]
GRIQKPAPLDVAKVALICPRCDKPSRVGKTAGAEGKMVRVCKKCGEPVDAS